MSIRPRTAPTHAVFAALSRRRQASDKCANTVARCLQLRARVALVTSVQDLVVANGTTVFVFCLLCSVLSATIASACYEGEHSSRGSRRFQSQQPSPLLWLTQIHHESTSLCSIIAALEHTGIFSQAARVRAAVGSEPSRSAA